METNGVIAKNQMFRSLAIQGHAAEGVCACLFAPGINPFSQLFEQTTMRLGPHTREKRDI